MCQNISIFWFILLRPRYFLFAGLVSALIPQSGLTAENWNLCRVPSFNYLEAEGTSGGVTRIEAQNISSESGTKFHLLGDARLFREGQQISADDVRLNKASGEVDASGDVEFATPNLRLQSPEIYIDSQNDQARFEQPEFELRDRHAHGQAASAEQLDQYRSRFSEITYSSCDPEDLDWYLQAEELELDDETGLGSATHTTIYFKDIPFLYLPYFQFPIDDRRVTGFLTPKIGSSETGGRSVAAPFYWNIAPNYDMTITPVGYTQRGLQLNTENRYLFESSSGQLDTSYLDDNEVGDNRWFYQWQHSADLGYEIETDLVLANVSDRDFFYDFGGISSRYDSIRHLDRHLRLARNGDIWQSEFLWQDFKTIDNTTATEDRPYNRLPRLTFNLQPEPWIEKLQTPVNIEWVGFDRDDSVTGNRANVVGALNWADSDSWYFFEPGFQLAFTGYQLDDNPGDDSITRTLPTLDIDSGLIFERLLGSTGQLLQTLEPRAYFLYTPYENQDDIPDFDTSLNARTYNNLFTNNRFTGADRIGDANQVTLGLTSRIYNNSNGTQLMSARIGQAFYFEDRRVSLDGSRDDSSRSDAIAELDLSPNSSWKISARMVYSEEQDEIDDRDLSVGYSNNGLVANFGYYYTDDELEQGLVSMVYPINDRWTVLAKYHQSLQFNETVENLLGISYESCCWGLKMLASQTGDVYDDFAVTENSIYFEITFKGLTQAGQDIDKQLSYAIPGYRPAF